MADFLNNWQTHMSKAGLRLDEEIYEPAVEDCTKALAVAENDEQRAESYYQRGYGYIGSTEFAILQGDMDKVNDLKNKATADWKKAADLGHNDAVRTLKEVIKINYTPQKPSSSGGSSSYSAPPPPKPAPQPQSPKYPQDIEIILSKNIKSEDELWKLAVYFESIGDEKNAAHWYDEQMTCMILSRHTSEIILKIAEYYTKGYSKWDYDLIKDSLKDAIGRDSGNFVDELKKCLKEFKKRK